MALTALGHVPGGRLRAHWQARGDTPRGFSRAVESPAAATASSSCASARAPCNAVIATTSSALTRRTPASSKSASRTFASATEATPDESWMTWETKPCSAASIAVKATPRSKARPHT